MRAPAAIGRGSVALAGLTLGVLILVSAASSSSERSAAVPPKSFNL